MTKPINARLIEIDTLRVRYISDTLDGSKIMAIKVDALVEDGYKKRFEIAWIRPESFIKLIPGKLGDRNLPFALQIRLSTELRDMTLSEAKNHVKQILLASRT